MGALVEAMYPLGPIFHGAGLNITVISSNGQPPRRASSPAPRPTPDLWDLAKHVPEELAALLAACGAAPSD